MPTELAKKVAGTFVPDESMKLGRTLAWATEECRIGRLGEHVKKFCDSQSELLDPALVLVEQVGADCLHCRIPCRCCDHESAKTFPLDVRFSLDPSSGKTLRLP
jgi:hypothetical protein